MSLLATGLCLWIAIHMLPSLGVGIKNMLVNRAGIVVYRAGFGLIVLCAATLIVLGWQSSQPSFVYLPVPALRPVAVGMVVLGFICLFATGRDSRIGRLVRFPQLTGMLLWACAHLLANGDSRSLLLFGGFAFWALLQMLLIRRREGPWIKPALPSWGKEILGVALALATACLIIVIHPWMTGMPVF